MKPSKLLVSGGAGFIGSNFVRYMLQERQDVHIVVLDKLTYAGNLENLSDIRESARFSFIQGDICNLINVHQAMQDCDWIVHFAAETHVDRSIHDPATFVQTNIQGTLVLLEAAKLHRVTRFVHISTDEVYGDVTAPDGSIRPSQETDSLSPYSPYAASKAGADCLALSYWRTYDLPIVITRCTNNYGPYQHLEKQIPLFISKAQLGLPLPIYGDGENTRDWIHVNDHCSALATILQAPAETVIGEIFNIGTGERRSALENARLILRLLGQPETLIHFVPDRLGHVRHHTVNTTKLRRRLGWKPKVPLEQGIRDTVDWYCTH